MENALPEIRKLLTSKRRLQRETGVRELKAVLEGHQGDCASLEAGIDELCADGEGKRWESKHGGLLAMCAYVRWKRGAEEKSSDELTQYIRQRTLRCLDLLVDSEVRVRLGAGEALGLCCEMEGAELYDELMEERLLTIIEDNLYLERDDLVEDTEDGRILKEKLLAGEAAQQAAEAEAAHKAACGHKHHHHDHDDKKTITSMASSARSSIYHDTAGWKSLESDVCALHKIVTGCGEAFTARAKPELLDLICQCSVHINRYVRGVSFRILLSLFESLGRSGGFETLNNTLEGTDVVDRLASGVADEWPQVRMDACVAVRKFFSFMTPEQRMGFYTHLLPRLCINRYFAAEGVRQYSQNTWRIIVEDQGAFLVAKFIDTFVPFYISQTRVANQEMREAACLCIGELASKIDKEMVGPHAGDMYDAMVAMVGSHAAWTVRIAACVALGQIVTEYPATAQTDTAQMVDLLFINNHDAVWSVREAAANTLGVVAQALGEDMIASVTERAMQGLGEAKQQPDDYQKYNMQKEDPSKLKQLHDNDVELHTDGAMFDCCSVGDIPEDTPMPHTHDTDAPNNWMITDGCFYIIRELTKVNPTIAERALPLMAEAVRQKQYMRHINLLETLWTVLPAIAASMQVKPFKRYLELFFDSMIYTLRDDERESKMAGDACARCITALVKFVGPLIFAGRVKQHDDMYLDIMRRKVPVLAEAGY